MLSFNEALDRLASDIYEINERKGFWDEPYSDDNELTVPAKLALIVDEVSEALQVHRDTYDDADEDPVSGMTPMQEDDFAEELADILIRTLDLAAAYDLDIGDAVVYKIDKNRNRPHKHNKRY